MQNKKWWQSSQHDGLKLRIKALIPLIVPLINNVGEQYGVNLVPEELDTLVDSIFIVIAAVAEIWGWVRAKINR